MQERHPCGGGEALWREPRGGVAAGAIAFVVPDFSEAYGLSCCAMEERCTEHGINLSCGGPDVRQYGGGARAV